MDFGVLVEEITRLVCERLDAAESLPGTFEVRPPVPPARSQSVLVMLAGQRPATRPGFDYEAFVQALAGLAKTTSVSFAVYPSAVWPCTGLVEQLPPGAGRLVAGLPDWRDEAAAHQALLVPHGSLGLLAKLAGLVADEPVVEAAVQMLILGRPVLVGSDDASAILGHSGGTVRGLQDVLRTHLRDLQRHGFHAAGGPDLYARLASLLGTPGTAGVSRSRAVVTQDDVADLHRQGQRKVVYPGGSIVTALAWEAAQAYGVEIVLQ